MKTTHFCSNNVLCEIKMIDLIVLESSGHGQTLCSKSPYKNSNDQFEIGKIQGYLIDKG